MPPGAQLKIFMYLLTEKEFEKFKDDLKKAKRRLLEITMQKGEAAEVGGNAWHDNFSFEELVRRENSTMVEIAKLRDIILKAKIVKTKEDHVVQVGSSVVVELGTNKGDIKEERFEIVGYMQSDPEHKKISYNSPLGAAVLGRSVGDQAEFSVGKLTKRIKIIRIE